MDRRALLACATAALAFRGLPSASSEEAQTKWTSWKARFLRPDGRVVDQIQGGVSHSEGQGYGLLLAQAEGDRAAFEAIEGWTRAQLLIRDDPLMAWRWRPGVGVRGDDWHTATDGDLFRAWALHRATVHSQWDGFGAAAAEITGALAALCLAPDPRAQSEPVLMPSAETRADPARLLFNPSYIMPRAMQELGAAYDAPELIRAADHGETLLAELAVGGLVPDWVELTPDGFRAAQDHSSRHSYDAIRVALYLAWSGRRAHPAVQQAARLFAGAVETPVVTTRDGEVLETSSYAGYHALRNLVLCDPTPPRTTPDEPYYPATIGRLAEVALRENGSCKT